MVINETDIVHRLLYAAKMAHEPNVLSRLNDTDLVDAANEIMRLRKKLAEFDQLSQENKTLHEQVAFLESREVCAKLRSAAQGLVHIGPELPTGPVQ